MPMRHARGVCACPIACALRGGWTPLPRRTLAQVLLQPQSPCKVRRFSATVVLRTVEAACTEQRVHGERAPRGGKESWCVVE